jgi:thiol-disulfide isomerase/thioredoxin
MYIDLKDKMSAETFNRKLRKGNMLVLYHADWCMHCQHLKPTWNEFVSKYGIKNKNMNIASIEERNMGYLKERPQIMGYPSIVMYRNGKVKEVFTDQRTISNLNKFSNKNTKSKLSKKKKKQSKKKQM